jgi:hypothetical protein
VTSNQVRGTGADAVNARGLDEGFGYARVRGEAEIIVAAEIDASNAIELDVGGVVGETPHGAPSPAEPAGVEIRQHGRE